MSKLILCKALPGLPPTVNHLYRTSRNSRRYKTKAGREWQKQASRLLAEQYRFEWHDAEPYAGDVDVTVWYITADKRRWDLDNRFKALLDTLIMAEVIRDDSQIKRLAAVRLISTLKQSSTVILVRSL